MSERGGKKRGAGGGGGRKEKKVFASGRNSLRLLKNFAVLYKKRKKKKQKKVKGRVESETKKRGEKTFSSSNTEKERKMCFWFSASSLSSLTPPFLHLFPPLYSFPQQSEYFLKFLFSFFHFFLLPLFYSSSQSDLKTFFLFRALIRITSVF